MSRRCIVNTNKGVLFGNNVSHSNRKVRRRFLPNMQNFALMSDVLGTTVRLKMTTHGMRTIEHNGGLDAYLLDISNSKLSSPLKSLKQRILRSMDKQDMKVNA